MIDLTKLWDNFLKNLIENRKRVVKKFERIRESCVWVNQDTVIYFDEKILASKNWIKKLEEEIERRKNL
jgi:hypothetical protein